MGTSLRRSAPGALKLLKPFALSRSEVSLLLFTIDSAVWKPTTTPSGAVLYLLTIGIERRRLDFAAQVVFYGVGLADSCIFFRLGYSEFY